MIIYFSIIVSESSSVKVKGWKVEIADFLQLLSPLSSGWLKNLTAKIETCGKSKKWPHNGYKNNTKWDLICSRVYMSKSRDSQAAICPCKR